MQESRLFPLHQLSLSQANEACATLPERKDSAGL